MKAIIIGAGPSGLTLAHYLNKSGYEVTVIDKAETIGGCIYVSNYVNTVKVLKELGINFYDYFTPYKFNLSNIGGSSLQNYSLREMYYLTKAYITGVNRTTTVAEFLSEHSFSDKAVDYTDRLCRLTDGAGIDRYTLYEFMQLINQNTLYGIYQPNIANDIGLFKSWKTKLEHNGVKFLLNTEVRQLYYNNGKINALTLSTGRNIQTDMCIMAIPPRNIFSLMQKSKLLKYISKTDEDFDKWSEQTDYLTYVPITFHWHDTLLLPPVYGFPKSDWGVAFIVLSDYLDMKPELSKTLISAALTRLDYISTVTGKTAHQSNNEELKTETLRQIRLSFPTLPAPDKIIISPDVYRKDGKWDTMAEAFMMTKHGYMPQYTAITNLYNVGTHNGYSSYAFTSMESAVQNAQVLSQKLTGHNIKIQSSYTLNQLIMLSLISMIIIILIIYEKRNIVTFFTNWRIGTSKTIFLK
jgi:hypothetical protein